MLHHASFSMKQPIILFEIAYRAVHSLTSLIALPFIQLLFFMFQLGL